ncbi:MAG TPA: HAMP domain-containing sensor histidine kinase [Rhodothermales bacterium]|nr:HAMP domain-containing sensor histidine kinase [Rhodothermales bacterium]
MPHQQEIDRLRDQVAAMEEALRRAEAQIQEHEEREEAMIQELAEAKERAKSIARMRSAILNNLTHEVRTPLTVIVGFTSMLRRGIDPKYMRFVDSIERSGNRLMLMLDTILDLAQLEAGTIITDHQMVDVVDVVDEAVGMLRPYVEESQLELRWERPAKSMTVWFDQRILSRVLRNLLDNAIKFTEEGYIEVSIEETKDWTSINVRDTGVGIDQLYQEQLFEEFSQESTGLERTHQGTGLGLAVSKRLMDKAGGTISVKSHKGKGSLFAVSVPQNEQVAA